MEHFYTYPTVTPLPRDWSRSAARELEAERRAPWPGSDPSKTARARPELYASSNSGGSDSTAS